MTLTTLEPTLIQTGEVAGKIAIVTGGSSGIGAATARALSAHGATVVVTDVADAAGEELAAELVREGATARYRHVDVALAEAWEDLVVSTEERYGRLDILVNNAGIGSMPDVESETLEGWERVIAVNQTGVWLGMRAVVPAMRRAGGGSIVNVSSIFGAVGGFGSSVAYHAAKGAVRLMSRNAAIRYAKEGIRVNSIHPGFIETPILAPIQGTPFEEAIVSGTPMGRLGRPVEIGEVIAFLASDRASYITGAEIFVDGGWTAQ